MPLVTARSQCRYGEMIYPRHDIYIGTSLRVYGEYGQIETDALLSLLHPGDVVVEAGANIGAITVPLARAVGEAGRVIAYEPQRVLHQILCANAAINEQGNVLALHAAAGAEAGHIHVPAVDYAGRHNFGGIALSADKGERVATIPVDDLDLPRLDLLKADVEGMEIEVLRGARETIIRHRPYLWVENDRRDKSEALIAFIRALGYRIWKHNSPLYNPNNWNGNGHNVLGNLTSFNIFCAHGDVNVDVRGLPEI